ncbi:hypothetical protein CDA01_24500 [Salmonella enterica subsp. enterica serovar Typhimurium]|nr:hypothetical protein [Salmonella enterica subsp. enterica serovar Typhimurium]EDL1993599.1 hypothetical protein [Salmonella enterica subsp. enterica serovar Typhimurium]EDQ5221366.1 hypothetical protein [Salmonella enterica subsp. enterica serovar Typhimurium]
MSIKNDGHYFCRAGGNRPDGLNEPVTNQRGMNVRSDFRYWVSRWHPDRSQCLWTADLNWLLCCSIVGFCIF